MSTLVLMRHGQASFGAARYDALSELGQAQARATGLWMRNQGIHPNAVLHGPRQRQADTANLLLKESGYLISGKQSEALDEFAEGEEIFSAAEQLLGRSWHSIRVGHALKCCVITMQPAGPGPMVTCVSRGD